MIDPNNGDEQVAYRIADGLLSLDPFESRFQGNHGFIDVFIRLDCINIAISFCFAVFFSSRAFCALAKKQSGASHADGPP